MSYRTFVHRDSLSSTSSESTYNYILENFFKMSNTKGYSVWTAAVFITSFMAGMGVLAMPRALAGLGWYGMFLIALACANSWYSATLLGRTWVILEERWEEYRVKFRYPYPAIGQRAVGLWMRYVVTMCLTISLLGIAIVYILLSAQIAQSMAHPAISLDYKYWIIILAAILCPLSWFGRIEEFWFAGVGALITAALACFALFADIIREIPNVENVTYGGITFSSVSLAFGTILFSYGGAYMFPSVQNDMANREQFRTAATLGYASLLLLYLPVTIGGYAVLGSAVPPNILLAMEKGYLRTSIEASLAIHVFLAFLIVINPVAQEIEEVLNVQPTFNYKRCLVRTAIVGVILLIGYAIPHFDKILNLVGGSAMTCLTFIFPPFFYMRLHKREQPEEPERTIPPLEKVFLCQIMLTGCIGAVSCTYTAVSDIVNVFISNTTADEMSMPL